MRTKEVIQALLNGKKIRRKSWADFQYVYLKDDKIYNQGGHYEDESASFGDGYEWEFFQEKPKVSYKDGRVSMEISPEEATKIFLLLGNMTNPVKITPLFKAIDAALFNDENPGPEFCVTTPVDFEKQVSTIVEKYFR